MKPFHSLNIMRLTEVLKCLRSWSTEIELRAAELRRCGKIWRFLNYTIKGSYMLLSAVATIMITLSATESSQKGSYAPMEIASIAINSASLFMITLDNAVNAGQKAVMCSQCSKEYIELSGDISLEVDTVTLALQERFNMDTDTSEFEEQSFRNRDILYEYKLIKSKYASKQTAIRGDEPFSPWFRSDFINREVLRAETDSNNLEELDEEALVAARSRTRKASQWKVTPQAEVEIEV